MSWTKILHGINHIIIFLFFSGLSFLVMLEAGLSGISILDVLTYKSFLGNSIVILLSFVWLFYLILSDFKTNVENKYFMISGYINIFVLLGLIGYFMLRPSPYVLIITAIVFIISFIIFLIGYYKNKKNPENNPRG